MTDPARPARDDLLARAMEHHRAGRLAAAAADYRAVLAASPDHAGALHNLGVVMAESGDPAAALDLFDRAVAGEPAYASAHFNRASALRALGKVDAAVDGFRRTVSLAPDHYEAHRALAFLWQALGRRDRALDHFARTLELRRGADRIGIADASLQYATPAKLRHDAAQFCYLAGLGRDSQRWELLARSYAGAAEEIGGAASPMRLSDDQLDVLGETYNLPFHVIDAPELPGPAVDPALDVAGITAAWEAAAPGVAQLDGLLTARALTLLLRFLLESTIWFDFSHIDGFLAAYLEDGLACPLILQIADELRAALPAVFGGHALVQGWAFKGLAGDRPIAPHADDAAISVNFWLTPDEANDDPNRGGLMICRTAPPRGRVIAGYDADRDEIDRFLAAHEDDHVIVPYRENRAVLFESRLFHGSDAPDFAPGYANHRINITLLYGGAR